MDTGGTNMLKWSIRLIITAANEIVLDLSAPDAGFELTDSVRLRNVDPSGKVEVPLSLSWSMSSA